jgi:hypothetical protein
MADAKVIFVDKVQQDSYNENKETFKTVPRGR